jgi:hypothetical protein
MAVPRWRRVLRGTPQLAQDTIDAEFETIRPQNRDIRAANTNRAASPKPGNDNDEIGLLKDAPAAPKPSPALSRAYFVTVGAAAIIAFLISGGHVLFTGPTSPGGELALIVQDATPVPGSDRAVTVSATIRNDGDTPKLVPDVMLTFEPVTGSDNLVYRLKRGETLGAGKSLAFTVRMAKKPGYREAPSLTFDSSGV